MVSTQVNEPYYPFNGTKVADFVIGVEENCHQVKRYCNGPLKPGTTYSIKVRAFTGRDKYADTSWSHSITTGLST